MWTICYTITTHVSTEMKVSIANWITLSEQSHLQWTIHPWRCWSLVFLHTHHQPGKCAPEEQQCGPENTHRHVPDIDWTLFLSKADLSINVNNNNNNNVHVLKDRRYSLAHCLLFFLFIYLFFITKLLSVTDMMTCWLKYETWDAGIVVIPTSCIDAILWILIKMSFFQTLMCP